jgi:hypothetical protein
MGKVDVFIHPSSADWLEHFLFRQGVERHEMLLQPHRDTDGVKSNKCVTGHFVTFETKSSFVGWLP